MPPANATPSILPSEIDRQHVARRRRPRLLDVLQRRAARLAISPSALSITSGAGSAFSRVSSMAAKSGMAMSGSSSSSTLNSRSAACEDAVADRMRGATLHLLGQQSEARDALEMMLASYEERLQRRHIVRFQYDQRLLAEVALARVLWLQGIADESLALVERLVEKAKLLNHGPTYANILAEAACPIALMAEDFPRAERFISLLRMETRAQSMDVWRTYADAFEGELLIRRGEPKRGMDVISPAPGRTARPRIPACSC